MLTHAMPEGWYEDPSDPARLRWWDGGAWSEFAGDGPMVEIAAVEPVHSERGLWTLEAEAAAQPHPVSLSTGSLSLADAIARVRAGEVFLPEPTVLPPDPVSLAEMPPDPVARVEPVPLEAVEVVPPAVQAPETAPPRIRYAVATAPQRRTSAWMWVVAATWTAFCVPAATLGWGMFAAALGLLPLLTGAYVALTGRRSWLRLASRQAGALVLSASLVLVVAGTVINRAVHPVLAVDTSILGFAAPELPGPTIAPGVEPDAASDARQPVDPASDDREEPIPSPSQTSGTETEPLVAPTSPAEVSVAVAPPEQAAPAAPTPTPSAAPSTPTPQVKYANCDAVRAAGAAPIHPGDPGWQKKFDRDGDGVGCDT